MVDLEKKLKDTLQKFYFIDEGSNFATCNYCNTTVAINFKSMIEHMKTQHDNREPEIKQKTIGSDQSTEEVVLRTMEVTDNGKRRSELATYGKKNSIKLNFNGSKGWCLLCDKYLSAHKNIFKQHVKGAIHKGHLELQGLKKQKKRSCERYPCINLWELTFDYVPEKKVFWIFDHSIDIHSFFLLRPIKKDHHFKKTKCYTCNELFPQEQEHDHCATSKHKNNLMAAKLIDDSHFEAIGFIREIRPNLFHCGYCNQTFPYSDLIKAHCRSSQHEYLVDENTQSYGTKRIEIKTNTEDMYMKLLQYGFGNILSESPVEDIL